MNQSSSNPATRTKETKMHATSGDWLVIKSASDSRHARRAEVLAAANDGGEPFTVRWSDTGREALVYPGPDAEIVSAARQVELDRVENRG
jgi:hypothetical protein